MTTDTKPSTDRTARQTMRDVDHTHPHGDPSLRRLYRRGETVVADGGKAGTKPKNGDENGEDKERMRDVDHTPPHDDEGANRVFERGGEHPEDDEDDDTDE